MQLIQIFLNPFISSLFLCKLVQLFCFLLSFWDQSGSFTFLSFLISSRWILIFFPPLFHCCLSEKEVQLKCLFDGEIGSVVFVHFFFLNFFFVRLLCESLPVQLSLYPLCFIFFFLLCRDALGVVYGNFCWIFPNSYNILAFPSSGSATKTI